MVVRQPPRALLFLVALVAASPSPVERPAPLATSNVNVYGAGLVHYPLAAWGGSGVSWGIGAGPPEVGGAVGDLGLAFSYAGERVHFNALYTGEEDSDGNSLAVSLGWRVLGERERDFDLAVWPFFSTAEVRGTGAEADSWGAALALGKSWSRLTATVGLTWVDGDFVTSDQGVFGSLYWQLGDRLGVFVEAGEETDAVRPTLAGGLVLAIGENLVLQVDYRTLDDDDPATDDDRVGVSLTLLG